MSSASVKGNTASPPHSSSQEPRFRIAVIGCGPKGLFFLERLMEKLTSVKNRRGLEIVIFEQAPYPGAGQVYDLRQPDYLRMNFASHNISAWPPNSHLNSFPQPTLVDWLQQYFPQMAKSDAFLPRALVGEYLHWCFQEVLEQLKRLADVRIERAAVSQITREGRLWRVDSPQDSSVYDEVLLTVGHEGWRSSLPQKLANHPADVDSVFPTKKQLSVDRVRPQSTVVIRGFGLTAIDAILAMTEGRGGNLKRRDGKWFYTPSGLEPSKIIPCSRSGRPMFAKPVPGKALVPEEVKNIWPRYREAMLQLPAKTNGLNFKREIWPVIQDAAEHAFNSCGGKGVRQWFDSWYMVDCDGVTAAELMQQSYRVAMGQQNPSAAWALGEAWRQLYPALVARISHGGMEDNSWADYRSLAAEMERLAFGPPAENLGRLLALIEQQIVDLQFVGGCFEGTASRSIKTQTGTPLLAVDHFVNAVLPTPSELAPEGLLAMLVQDGLVYRHEPSQSLLVNHEARPLAKDGRPMAGLAIFGRCTEGCILGNDTLSRTLHNHPDAWANSVCNHLLSSKRQRS